MIDAWIPVIVQLIIAFATLSVVVMRLPKQRSEIKVDTSQAASNLTAAYDRLLAEKDKQLEQRDQSLANAMQQAALVPQQTRQIEALEADLTRTRSLLSERQDLSNLQSLLTELITILKRKGIKP